MDAKALFKVNCGKEQLIKMKSTWMLPTHELFLQMQLSCNSSDVKWIAYAIDPLKEQWEILR